MTFIKGRAHQTKFKVKVRPPILTLNLNIIASVHADDKYGKKGEGEG